MQDEKKPLKRAHNIIIENRRNITITGVMDVDSFDEELVVLFTEEGELTIKGINLHINKVDVDSGELTMEGEVDMLAYSQVPTQNGGFFAKLLR